MRLINSVRITIWWVIVIQTCTFGRDDPLHTEIESHTRAVRADAENTKYRERQIQLWVAAGYRLLTCFWRNFSTLLHAFTSAAAACTAIDQQHLVHEINCHAHTRNARPTVDQLWCTWFNACSSRPHEKYYSLLVLCLILFQMLHIYYLSAVDGGAERAAGRNWIALAVLWPHGTRIP